jgi:hypothetical protein
MLFAKIQFRKGGGAQGCVKLPVPDFSKTPARGHLGRSTSKRKEALEISPDHGYCGGAAAKMAARHFGCGVSRAAPFRRFAIGRVSANLNTLDFAHTLQDAILRYGKLQICGALNPSNHPVCTTVSESGFGHRSHR